MLIKNLIADLKNAIVERIKAMDNMANGKIPDDLVFMILTKRCMPAGQLENLEINFCHKTKIGLFCELQINTFNYSYLNALIEYIIYTMHSVRKIFEMYRYGQFDK